jgi:Zn finger protein HypA/HybF involved in hydrogenase expression
MSWTKFVPFVKKSYDKIKWGDKAKRCLSPSHNPPTMQVLEPGIHTWKCPACGKEQKIIIEEKEMHIKF